MKRNKTKQENNNEKNQALRIFPNMLEVIEGVPEQEQAGLALAIIKVGFGKEPEALTLFQQMAITLLKPILKLASVGGNPNFKKGQANPYYQKDNSNVADKITSLETEEEAESEAETKTHTEAEAKRNINQTLPPSNVGDFSYPSQQQLTNEEAIEDNIPW